MEVKVFWGWVGGSDGEFIENFGLQLKDYSIKRV
jgi:hypothetical protein